MEKKDGPHAVFEDKNLFKIVTVSIKFKGY